MERSIVEMSEHKKMSAPKSHITVVARASQKDWKSALYDYYSTWELPKRITNYWVKDLVLQSFTLEII